MGVPYLVFKLWNWDYISVTCFSWKEMLICLEFISRVKHVLNVKPSQQLLVERDYTDNIVMIHWTLKYLILLFFTSKFRLTITFDHKTLLIVENMAVTSRASPIVCYILFYVYITEHKLNFTTPMFSISCAKIEQCYNLCCI